MTALDKHNRSVFLKGESYNDYLTALTQSGMDKKRFDWERMKQNGCTHESETRFRQCAKACGFVLPDEEGKANPLAKDTVGRQQARLLADSIKGSIRNDKIVQD